MGLLLPPWVPLTIGVSGLSKPVRVHLQRAGSVLVSLSRGFVTRHYMTPGGTTGGTEGIEETLG